jgi:acetyl-CoA carboxylase biotin carboxyl carrier protein
MDQLKALIEFMDEHNLAELEVEQEGGKVRLVKFGAGVREVAAVPAFMPPAMGMPGAAMGQAPVAEAVPSNIKEIKAPMVGTFYRAPSPDSDPFADVGAEVNSETVVCIIEAMKVMNEIRAEMEGRVVEILVENGQPVEYGQPLFRVQAEG